MRNRTAALIPCANDDYSLFLSVQALAEAVDEVCIVDDCSEDESPRVVEWHTTRIPNVTARRADRPLGWAEVRNELALMTDARHLFFVDADDILLDGQVHALQKLAESPAAFVQLGLAEMWGDFHHGTGRGIETPHFDPCHCYVDRDCCTDARWSCVSSHAHLATSARPVRTADVLFWHAKGVKSDWRLVARRHLNDWMQGSRQTTIGKLAAFVRENRAIHDAALRRLLHDRIDRIQPLPPAIEIPRVCAANVRFRMEYRDGSLVDRTDMGWSLDQ